MKGDICMKKFPSSWWRVPLYCVAAGIVTFWVTVLIGGRFIAVTDMGADGIPTISVDPVRSATFNGILFVAVLLIGGFWFLKGMEKREIAVSAAIASLIYLLLVAFQVFLPAVAGKFVMQITPLQNWIAIPGALLTQLTHNVKCSIWMTNFTPFLFLLFGKKR